MQILAPSPVMTQPTVASRSSHSGDSTQAARSEAPQRRRAKVRVGPIVVDGRSLTAALLAGVALMGRILMLLTEGKASALQLVAVLLIGATAFALGTNAIRGPGQQFFSRLLARVGQRAGAIQVGLSLFSLIRLI